MTRVALLPAAALLLAAGLGSIFAFNNATTSTSSTSSLTTSTTVPRERAQPSWAVASSSARGVMVDYKNEIVGPAAFRVLRLRARTTLLRWHVGLIDPPAKSGEVPADAGPAIFWPSEGLAGVVAVFNGAFKKAANSGGAVVDGVVLEPLVVGDMTIAINAHGHWSMGVWGSSTFPAKDFHAIAYRQNLRPLVQNSRLSASANPTNWAQWGSPLNHNPLTPRTGLGVDANGNLIFVATMSHVDIAQLGEALVGAGVVSGMELDMNPYWPILGASKTALHAPGGVFAVQLPLSEHSPSIYETGWLRDFFVALAEPNSWSCDWTSPGVRSSITAVQPQRLHLTGPGCRSTTTTTTTTTTGTTGTSSTTTTTGSGATTTTGAG
jgi:hypothetical protein